MPHIGLLFLPKYLQIFQKFMGNLEKTYLTMWWPTIFDVTQTPWYIFPFAYAFSNKILLAQWINGILSYHDIPLVISTLLWWYFLHIFNFPFIMKLRLNFLLHLDNPLPLTFMIIFMSFQGNKGWLKPIFHINSLWIGWPSQYFHPFLEMFTWEESSSRSTWSTMVNIWNSHIPSPSHYII